MKSFCIKFNFFRLEDNCFILCWYLPNINMNKPQVYIYPLPLKPPSHLPLHHSSLGCHRVLGLSSLHGTANTHWLSILHMVMYMLQSYFLYSSRPLLPTLRPQVCSLCLCLQCCSANRFQSLVPSFQIPHICVSMQYLFFLTFFICMIDSRFIYLIRTDSNVFFLWPSNIPLYTCTTSLLYLLIYF